MKDISGMSHRDEELESDRDTLIYEWREMMDELNSFSTLKLESMAESANNSEIMKQIIKLAWEVI